LKVKKSLLNYKLNKVKKMLKFCTKNVTSNYNLPVYKSGLKKAFTLIEILFSLVVLGVGLVAILSLFAVGSYSARRALNSTRAALFAQTVFEELKEQSITNFSGINDDNPTYDIFTANLDVIDNPLGGDVPNLKMLELTISWDDTSEVFVTYVTKYSP